MRNQISSEYRLLLVCARSDLSEAYLSELKALVETPLDWSRALELALWHRLAPLLFFNLDRAGLAGAAPEPIIQQLQKAYYSNAARNLHLQGELRKVLASLQSEDIPAVALKGAALAETVYRHAALRPMSDLDILVREDHLARADAIVRDLGYSSYTSPAVQRKTREEHRHYPVLADQDWCVKFEIHRHILRRDSPLYFDLDGFWSRARPGAIAGAPTLILGPEDQLIHLCLNFFVDRHNRSNGALGQLVDISETILRYQDTLDWDLLIREARQHSLQGPVWCGLWATEKLVGTAPPQEVRRALNPTRLRQTTPEHFIEKRVLETRPWLAHNLAGQSPEYNFRNVLKNAFRRAAPDSDSLAGKYGYSGRPKVTLGLYLRRALEALGLLARYSVRPLALRRDLQIDRWMHSLSKQI